MNQKLYYLLAFLLLLGSEVIAQTQITIADSDLEGGQTYNWTSDNIYLLDGFVFLEAGGTLNIEAGTVIKGLGTPSTGDNASALIISRDAQLFAEGTAEEPIIFTAENDDVSIPDDLLPTDRGLWGGLIVLGNAQITANTPTKAIEGIPAGDDRAVYGGDEDTDNSGVIRYISIRHGGAALAEGNEINGLTLGAVGSGTQIDHIEVFANFDDGIEWFGGTVSVKYASVSWCGDDSFDWDQGWRGEGQFWFSLQGNDTAGNGAEQDGAGDQDSNTPVSNPSIYNATYIGSGASTPSTVGNEHALLFRDASAGSYSNSIFTDFAQFAIQVENTDDPFDSRSQMINSELVLQNNLWSGFGAGDELSEIINPTESGGDIQFLIDHLTNNNNQLDDPMIANIDRFENLDPRPNFGGPAYQSSLADFPNSDFFTPVRFKGAFCNDGVWIQGWTALAQSGILDSDIDLIEDACDELVAVVGERIIRDEDLVENETYNWSKDSTYILDGFVFLEAGGILNIEEGTVIKALGTPTTGDNASALIIARDAQIFAEGTFEEPIIFTAENDDINDPGDLLPTDRGLWGGLIVLGNAAITANTPTKAIEGIPAGDDRAVYGGDDDTDNSGVIRFISIRHGGAALAEGNEINGLTLGAVGSGTQIDHLEVFANFDDGIEWFGGTVDVKYATVAWCGDDSFDWDQGYRGRGQYWFSIQGTDTAGNGAEQDGAGDQDSNEPVSNPVIYNATYIGSGAMVDPTVGNEHALLFRDATAGTYGNSIFTDFAQFALQVEDTGDPFDSRSRMINGELNLLNNLWFGFGAGDELGEIINPTESGGDIQFAIDHLSNNDNQLVDPLISSIDRFADGLLDPRAATDGPAYTTSLASVPEDAFYDNVIFKGAFCSEGLWIQNWTALAQYGVLDAMIPYVGEGCELSTSTDEVLTESNGYLLKQSVPNPASDVITIDFTIPRTTNVSLTIYSSEGRIVAQPVNNDTFLSGEHRLEFNVSNLPNGIYFYNLRNAEVSITKAIVVDKR